MVLILGCIDVVLTTEAMLKFAMLFHIAFCCYCYLAISCLMMTMMMVMTMLRCHSLLVLGSGGRTGRAFRPIFDRSTGAWVGALMA